MPRSEKTKQLLAQSLRELMNSTPLEEISVGDIVARAGVGRNTFYYHFMDKYDLVNWYFETGMTLFLENKTNYKGWLALLYAIEQYFRENKAFYQNALHYEGQNSLRNYMIEQIGREFDDQLRQAAPDLDARNRAFACRFLTGSLMGVLIPWVEGGMKEEVAEYYDCLVNLCNGVLPQLMLQQLDNL